MEILISGVSTAAFAVAAKFASAGVISIIWAASPIFTALWNAQGEGETHGWRLIVSLILGMTGVILVLTGNFPFSARSSQSSVFIWTSDSFALMSELAMLGSTMLYSFATRLAKQNTAGIPIATLVIWEVLFSSLFLSLISVLFEHDQTFHFTWEAIGSLLYISIICSVGCNLIMFWLIRRIGATRTAYSDFFVPGVTLFTSHFLVGESLTLAKLGGLALVLLGAIFAF